MYRITTRKLLLPSVAALLLHLNIMLQAQSVVLPGAIITSDQTWRGTVIVKGDVVVKATARLLIEPGTRILFEADSDDQRSGVDKTRGELIVEGILIARGSIENKITFSVNSDAPRMGNWYGISILNPSGKSILDYVIIEYAYNGISVKKSSPQITNSQFRFNYNAGVLTEVRAEPVLLKNVISENGYAGIICNLGAKPVLSENLITLNQIGLINFSLSQPNLGSLSRDAGYNEGKNRIFENKDYNIYNHANLPLKAENNSWGFSGRNEVKATIFDAANDQRYGAVDFEPFIQVRSDLNEYMVMIQDPVPSQPTAQAAAPARQEPLLTGQTAGREPIAEVTQNQQEQVIAQFNALPLQAEQRNASATRNVQVPEEEAREETAPEELPERMPEQNQESQPEQQPKNGLRLPPPRPEREEQPHIDYEQVFLEPFLDNKREILNKVTPIISDPKRGLGAKGIVQVRVIVGKDGLVESAQVLRGLNPYYDRISTDAAQKFRFKPGTIGGNVVRFSTNLFFEF